LLILGCIGREYNPLSLILLTNHIYRLYVIWAVFIILYITLTVYGITQEKRVHYVLLFVATEILLLCTLLAASALDEMPKRLQTWGPVLTMFAAGNPTLAFDKRKPDAEDSPV
jgi:hypothetical protein